MVLVLAVGLVGYRTARQTAKETFSPAEVRRALRGVYPDRAAPFPLFEPPPVDEPEVAPARCSTLLLRPWLVDAWPEGAIFGSQTGSAAPDSFSSFEVVTFTTSTPSRAEDVYDDAAAALTAGACDQIVSTNSASLPYRVSLRALEPESATAGCTTLSNLASAAPAPAGNPADATVELLRYGNTLSLLVQPGDVEEMVLAGSSWRIDEDGPELAALCSQLQRLGSTH